MTGAWMASQPGESPPVYGPGTSEVATRTPRTSSRRGSDSMDDNRKADRVAAVAAIAAGLAWVAWTVLNSWTRGGLESEAGLASPRLARLAPLLTAGWNLLLIPAALSLWRQLSPISPGLVLIYTAAGVTSLAFWAFGGLTRITPALEITYLALSAVWWLGVGSVLWRERPALAVLTIAAGGFSALDSALCALEPVPGPVFALAAPKLPLCAAWSILVGVTCCAPARV